MDFNPKILYRFFNGDYSRKDYFEIKSIFSEPENRLRLKEHLKRHWSDFSDKNMPEHNIESLLHKIHHKIRLEENTFQRYKFISIFQKVAAILIVPLILSFFAIVYFQSNKEKNEVIYESNASAEIQCPLGVRTKFELPDGTTGFLNSGSWLKYPVNFITGRNVSISGEVYLDVIHDELRPFIVHTSNLQIKVLGTQFNVISYEDDFKEKVILNQGKVDISSLEGEKLAVLQPNQKLILNTESRTFETNEVEASQYIGWTEGKLIFRNENMQQVAERLGRWYNADIKIEDPELLKYAFRATFIDESLEEVLKLLALTAPLTYEEQPRISSSDKTYQKRTVLVKLDKKRLMAFN